MGEGRPFIEEGGALLFPLQNGIQESCRVPCPFPLARLLNQRFKDDSFPDRLIPYDDTLGGNQLGQAQSTHGFSDRGGCGRYLFMFYRSLSLGRFFLTGVENGDGDSFRLMNETGDDAGLPAQPFPERPWPRTSDHKVSDTIFFCKLEQGVEQYLHLCM